MRSLSCLVTFFCSLFWKSNTYWKLRLKLTQQINHKSCLEFISLMFPAVVVEVAWWELTPPSIFQYFCIVRWTKDTTLIWASDFSVDFISPLKFCKYQYSFAWVQNRISYRREKNIVSTWWASISTCWIYVCSHSWCLCIEEGNGARWEGVHTNQPSICMRHL